MSKNLYIVPFLGIGRKITLDVRFAYRGDGNRCDHKCIEYAGVWTKSPFESLYEKIGRWCSGMLILAEEAESQGYVLRGSSLTLGILQQELRRIIWLSGSGHGEKASAVGEFLMVLHGLNPDITDTL